ncbi:MAG: phytanoyl-CoA dioxygenase [Sphingomonadales bacterium]|nr:phytanoyl-CoA dioxygenase [Sphingomonadales bacterium]
MPDQSLDQAAIMGGLYGDGIIALRGAFSPEWADRMAEDVWRCFEEAKAVPGGALPRGPNRFYVEVQPEKIRGFVDVATHPWFVAVCEAVLARDYRIVEVGFDIPFPGAMDQPWHRDFASPEATLRGRRLNSLAFNGMFPDRALWPRYIERAAPKMPQRGDISVRSALTIHRGTANRSSEPRPVLVVGVDAPDATNAQHHDLQVTAPYLAQLPSRVRDHLDCRVVDRLEQVVQHHVIEGLVDSY